MFDVYQNSNNFKYNFELNRFDLGNTMNISHIIFIIMIIANFAIGSDNAYCQMCGMGLEEHKQSNHKITHNDTQGEKNIYVCSLHCAYDAINNNSTLKDALIEGIDNSTISFKPIKELFYVIGSAKKSAMTSESEFAFATLEEAEKFRKENGGRIVNGSDILQYESMKFEKDSAMIETNRAKMSKMGKNIADEYCNQNALKAIKADDIAAFKLQAKEHCKNIDEKGLQAVAIYFWFK